MTSTSLIFLNPRSEVTSGTFRNTLVAAIIASGTLIDCFCRKRIATSFISGRRSITSHSFNKAFNFFFSGSLIFGQPKSSISVITEMATDWSRKGLTNEAPSCSEIKKLVSATKSIPLITQLFLIRKAIKPSFQFAKVLTECFLSFHRYCPGQRLLHLLLCEWSLDFNNHVSILYSKISKRIASQFKKTKSIRS